MGDCHCKDGKQHGGYRYGKKRSSKKRTSNAVDARRLAERLPGLREPLADLRAPRPRAATS